VALPWFRSKEGVAGEILLFFRMARWQCDIGFLTYKLREQR
jgi:hypothetical protein